MFSTGLLRSRVQRPYLKTTTSHGATSAANVRRKQRYVSIIHHTPSPKTNPPNRLNHPDEPEITQPHPSRFILIRGRPFSARLHSSCSFDSTRPRIPIYEFVFGNFRGQDGGGGACCTRILRFGDAACLASHISISNLLRCVFGPDTPIGLYNLHTALTPYADFVIILTAELYLLY